MDPAAEPPRNLQFHTTRWSRVVAAQDTDPATALAALAELCERYWQPLYAFLRSAGRDEHAAMDLLQGFLTGLLEGGRVQGAEAGKGRFRAYLIGALNNYLRNQARNARAQRRGGGQQVFSLDDAEARFDQVAVPGDSPEQAFDRHFAQGLLEGCLRRLGEEYAERGRQAVHDALLPFLTTRPARGTYHDLARQTGLDSTTIKVTVHRMRARLRQLLLAELSHGLEDPGAAEAELDTLLEALRR